MVELLQKRDVNDLGQTSKGRLRIEWADSSMPVLSTIRSRFEKEKPLVGQTIGACLHVTSETANLARTLKAGGAEVFLCGSNPLSTQDDVAAALVSEYDIPTFAIKGEDNATYYRHISSVLEQRPTITMDDGCDLVTMLHKDHPDLIDCIIGGTEETTTGVIRLRSMEADGVLRYPIIAVNEADTKHLFDNRYGTGQSTIDGLIRATNVLLAGKRMVIAGYGWCGRGLASRAKGMGAHVTVTEVDPTRAIEAVMDGFEVMTMAEAAPIADIFITVTGNVNVINRDTLIKMKDGAIVANSGHFNDEIDIDALRSIAGSSRQVREFVEEFMVGDKRIFLLAEGRLLNLSAAEGHPADVMDMSFADQALSVEHLVKNHDRLKPEVYIVPAAIDREVARLKLASMGVEIDTVTAEQETYVRSWQSGT